MFKHSNPFSLEAAEEAMQAPDPNGPNVLFEIGPDGQFPTRGSGEAAGLDLYAAHDVEIPGWGKVKVRLDIKSEFRPGWVGLILDRSGLGSKGITHLAGVIDSDFRGEWLVALFNANYGSFQIEKGDRIAQVVFTPCWIGEPKVGNVGVTNRGEGGFGSTGR